MVLSLRSFTQFQPLLQILLVKSDSFSSQYYDSKHVYTKHQMKLWYFSSSINSFFKSACAAIQWGKIWLLVGPFVYFRTLCEGTAKSLGRLRGCAGSPEPSLVAYVISTIISCTGSNEFFSQHIVYLQYPQSAVNILQQKQTITFSNLSRNFMKFVWLVTQ